MLKRELDELFYKTGKQICNFSICTKFNNGGWSKWIPYLEAQLKPSIWRGANNRQILFNEIVLDYDRTPDESADEIKARVMMITRKLDKEGYAYRAYFTGSKGYHIHLVFRELFLLSKIERKNIKEQFIEKYNAEKLKGSERVMIAMENTPHFRTGNKKEIIKERAGDNLFI